MSAAEDSPCQSGQQTGESAKSVPNDYSWSFKSVPNEYPMARRLGSGFGVGKG